MSNNENKIIVTPSPERLISSLMNIGYDFVTAVSDLVDNSVEAGATKISIYVHFEGKKSAVRISDNGRGMAPETMKEAMRFGTERDYGLSDLGKFGLGLKTASLSQCRNLTVASRPSHDEAGVHAMSWDMDHLEKSKAWEVLQISENNLPKHILKPILNSTGTVVYWSQLKYVFEYKNPDGGFSENRLIRMCRELENHLAMVFHRFIENENTNKSIEITLNGNRIKAWNPFAQNEQHTREHSPIILEIEEGDVKSDIRMIPFILPSKNLFSTPEAFRLASGPANWNQQQGFYIYRAERMIQSGGWCGIRTMDEHTKLARIALHFPPALDNAFNIDVAKMSVNLPSSLKSQIKKHISLIIKSAQDAYRHPKSTDNGKGKESFHKNQSNTEADTQASQSRNPQRWTLEDIFTLFRGVALPEELPVLEKIIKRIRGKRQ